MSVRDVISLIVWIPIAAIAMAFFSGFAAACLAPWVLRRLRAELVHWADKEE